MNRTVCLAGSIFLVMAAVGCRGSMRASADRNVNSTVDQRLTDNSRIRVDASSQVQVAKNIYNQASQEAALREYRAAANNEPEGFSPNKIIAILNGNVLRTDVLESNKVTLQGNKENPVNLSVGLLNGNRGPGSSL